MRGEKGTAEGILEGRRRTRGSERLLIDGCSL